ncbi:hypothetical protein JDV02_000004 [Purpureocillium takamizusanense]|uniref:GrpB domain protein n=1 Tax=Purpureocillium takamizusanense TaxID=2060973 RepID=A0A9Q8Q670_9HYPO|nr:uncharacterized protein JDV02_000004 [Purpureocillium takamizusanense]UNI13246.1 hypothetical protein JDV02_000004 [Purpureocillium takamizusanense]
MPSVPLKELVKHDDFDPELVERIAERKFQPPVAMVEADPSWARHFAEAKARIEDALGATAVSVAHVGSTSVPGMPAKAIIDVDLTVRDVRDEAAYVGPLERSAGFVFLLREPHWHEHRFFCQGGARGEQFPINLHVWGPGCPEAERHRIFRDWLTRSPDDFALYARTKREAAEVAARNGESVMQYNLRKERTIRDILDRAFRDLGYVE